MLRTLGGENGGTHVVLVTLDHSCEQDFPTFHLVQMLASFGPSALHVAIRESSVRLQAIAVLQLCPILISNPPSQLAQFVREVRRVCNLALPRVVWLRLIPEVWMDLSLDLHLPAVSRYGPKFKLLQCSGERRPW